MRTADLATASAPMLRVAALFPGLFPPALDVEGATRRVLIALLLVLSVGGALVDAAALDDFNLVVPFALAVGGIVVAAAVPWHRFTRDAFAAVGLAVTAWTVWVVAITGGSISPYAPLSFLGVAVLAVPLTRNTGLVLGLLAAAFAALPLVYDPTINEIARRPQELIIRSVVLAVAAVFTAWLADEVRRAVDVASARRAELETEQEVTSDLRKAQSARSEYLSILAHELRNPLNAINAAARVLAKDIAGKDGEATARAIATESRHALDLLDGLTDVASLESGRMRLALRSTDLSAVLREVATGAVEGHKVSLRGAERPLFVLGDDRRLGQVVRNLISNAAKYSPQDEEIQASLGMSSDRRNAIVQVRDHGPGIPPAERDRLFQRFARLSTAGGTRGSGLGLYISRGIVNDHGGQMWADWPAGGGSVFSFSVPLTGESTRGSAP